MNTTTTATTASRVTRDLRSRVISFLRRHGYSIAKRAEGTYQTVYLRDGLTVRKPYGDLPGCQPSVIVDHNKTEIPKELEITLLAKFNVQTWPTGGLLVNDRRG